MHVFVSPFASTAADGEARCPASAVHCPAIMELRAADATSSCCTRPAPDAASANHRTHAWWSPMRNSTSPEP